MRRTPCARPTPRRASPASGGGETSGCARGRVASAASKPGSSAARCGTPPRDPGRWRSTWRCRAARKPSRAPRVRRRGTGGFSFARPAGAAGVPRGGPPAPRHRRDRRRLDRNGPRAPRLHRQRPRASRSATAPPRSVRRTGRPRPRPPPSGPRFEPARRPASRAPRGAAPRDPRPRPRSGDTFDAARARPPGWRAWRRSASPPSSRRCWEAPARPRRCVGGARRASPADSRPRSAPAARREPRPLPRPSRRPGHGAPARKGGAADAPRRGGAPARLRTRRPAGGSWNAGPPAGAETPPGGCELLAATGEGDRGALDAWRWIVEAGSSGRRGPPPARSDRRRGGAAARATVAPGESAAPRVEVAGGDVMDWLGIPAAGPRSARFSPSSRSRPREGQKSTRSP